MDRWSPAQAIYRARIALALEPAEVAERVGPTLAWYEALERDDGAVLETSLAHLTLLASVLHTSPQDLLLGPATSRPKLTFRTLAAAVEAHARAHDLSIDELSARVRWDLSEAVVDTETFWNLTVDDLRRVAAEVGLDWVGLLSGGLPIVLGPTYE